MKYTLEIIKEEALKYSTRGDFFNQSQPYYKAAHRNGWLDNVCQHMTLLHRKAWTPEAIAIEAKKYNTQKEFELGSSGAYKAALRLGIIDQVRIHMSKEKTPPANKKWYRKNILEDAIKYKTKQEWRNHSPGAYSAALKLKILDEATSHMKRPEIWNKHWTYEISLFEVLKNTNRSEFQQTSPGAYDFLQSNGLLEKAYEEANIKRLTGESFAELEIMEWIKSFNLDVLHKIKILDSRKEMDVYIPSLKIAIEYCGIYWHSEQFLDKNTHKEKMDLCHKNDIRLITIFEDEWQTRKEQIKGHISSYFTTNRKIYGRNTKILPIDLITAKIFLENYHIQGYAHNTFTAFGLYEGIELCGVITGGNHPRRGSEALILNRLCFSYGISIIGGSSKLFSALKQWAINNNYKKIISWSDNRWSEGKVYKALGFELEKELSVDYSYFKANKRYSKQSLKKTDSEKLMNKTERQIRKEQGYLRIWDCGKKRWIVNL